MALRLPRRRARQARKPALDLPHERDQSTGQTDPQPTDVMRQAKADIDNGLVDTDLRATPGLDAERREKLLKPRST